MSQWSCMKGGGAGRQMSILLLSCPVSVKAVWPAMWVQGHIHRQPVPQTHTPESCPIEAVSAIVTFAPWAAILSRTLGHSWGVRLATECSPHCHDSHIHLRGCTVPFTAPRSKPRSHWEFHPSVWEGHQSGKVESYTVKNVLISIHQYEIWIWSLQSAVWLTVNYSSSGLHNELVVHIEMLRAQSVYSFGRCRSALVMGLLKQLISYDLLGLYMTHITVCNMVPPIADKCPRPPIHK